MNKHRFPTRISTPHAHTSTDLLHFPQDSHGPSQSPLPKFIHNFIFFSLRQVSNITKTSGCHKTPIYCWLEAWLRCRFQNKTQSHKEETLSGAISTSLQPFHSFLAQVHSLPLSYPPRPASLPRPVGVQSCITSPST